VIPQQNSEPPASADKAGERIEENNVSLADCIETPRRLLWIINEGKEDAARWAFFRKEVNKVSVDDQLHVNARDMPRPETLYEPAQLGYTRTHAEPAVTWQRLA